MIETRKTLGETLMMKHLSPATVIVFASTIVHAATSDGMVITQSHHGVTETTERAVTAIKSRGLKVIARIDHAAGAAKAGLALRPTRLLQFGNPKVGTPLMHCRRTVAIDLPQKLLIWEDEQGVTRVAYNAPDWHSARHGLGNCAGVLKKVQGALSGIAAAATE